MIHKDGAVNFESTLPPCPLRLMFQSLGFFDGREKPGRDGAIRYRASHKWRVLVQRMPQNQAERSVVTSDSAFRAPSRKLGYLAASGSETERVASLLLVSRSQGLWLLRERI